MKNTVYMGQSLDGYIAGPNGELDWLEEIDNPDHSDMGFTEFMSRIDALIMGRQTFETLLGFGVWPYDKPIFVASNTLETLPAEVEGKAFLLRGSPRDMLAALHAQDMTRIYIDGGALVQSFMREGLIDEIILATLPVVLGDGISLFGSLPKRQRLRLVGSEVLLGQLVKSHYEVIHEPA